MLDEVHVRHLDQTVQSIAPGPLSFKHVDKWFYVYRGNDLVFAGNENSIAHVRFVYVQDDIQPEI